MGQDAPLWSSSYYLVVLGSSGETFRVASGVMRVTSVTRSAVGLAGSVAIVAILSCVWYALVALDLARKQRGLSSDGRTENGVDLSLDLTTLSGVSRMFNSDVKCAGVCRGPIDFVRVELTDQGDKKLHFGHRRGAAPVMADGRAINGVTNGEGDDQKVTRGLDGRQYPEK